MMVPDFAFLTVLYNRLELIMDSGAKLLVYLFALGQINSIV